MITFHPERLHARPASQGVRAGDQGARKETDEVAVMIDARDALEVAALPDGVEWAGYVSRCVRSR